jgi:hypothetical protein
MRLAKTRIEDKSFLFSGQPNLKYVNLWKMNRSPSDRTINTNLMVETLPFPYPRQKRVNVATCLCSDPGKAMSST